MPDITVITPSLNQGQFIEQTIISVVEQQGVDLQYIVVDGVSQDATGAILERYRDRIGTLLIEPDEGQADALRKGFALAQAPICGYLNSDDYLLAGALKAVVDYFAAHPDVDAVYTDRVYVDEKDHPIRYWRLPRHSSYMMCRWDFIPQETCFWRREAMEEVGGIDPSYRFAVDYDLFARMMIRGKRFVHLPGFVGVFREHPCSKTSTQLDQVGLAEMERVRCQSGIRIKRYELLFAALYYALLQIRSTAYLWMHPNGPDVFRRRHER